jgi:ankyrin repeat protein
LDETYDEVMKRIFKQNKNDARLGGKVLSWISYAKRPLTVDEMQHAVKVETNSTSIGKGDLIPEDILVSVCAGIVTVDQGSNIIRLVHYTTQEYLLRTRSVHFPGAEQEIGNACLTYLLFDNFKDGYCKTDEELESLLEENALLDYAARNWADHAREVTGSVMGAALKFLEDTPRTSLSFQVVEIGSFHYHRYSQAPSKYVSGLHLCAYFGMYHMIMKMIETHSEAEKGAELDSKDDDGRTPLSWAAALGYEAVAKLLLEKGAELESKDDDGQTPLLWAAARGHEAVVKLLLEKGAELESKSRTPLSWAAEGHKAVVKLVLEKDGKLDNYSHTPLLYAAAEGHEAIVKLLLEKGAERESKDNDGQTPLSLAVVRGYEAVAKLLIEKGAELESKDNNGLTPLSRAAAQGHEAVAKLLLEKGAELKSKDNGGRTPLSYAAAKGHKAVAKLLLEKGADNSQII